MCLAVTGRVVSAEGDAAIVTIAGRNRSVSRVLEPESSTGDWVSVGMGWILRRLTPAEAERLLVLEAELEPSLATLTAAPPGERQ
jgi:hydrogenase maturation factor